MKQQVVTVAVSRISEQQRDKKEGLLTVLQSRSRGSRRFLWGVVVVVLRAASEGWQPPMSKEDTRESPLAQKCYWYRIIPEVGGHFDPCTKQGTPTTRRRPPLVGLRVQPDAQKGLKQHRKKSFSLLLIAIVRVDSHQVTLAN